MQNSESCFSVAFDLWCEGMQTGARAMRTSGLLDSVLVDIALQELFFDRLLMVSFSRQKQTQGWVGINISSLNFFTQISGRNFLPELCGEVHPETAPLQAVSCALCSTEQSTFRGGRKRPKGAEKRGGTGVANKGGKKEKRKKGRMKTDQICLFAVCCPVPMCWHS